VLFENPHFAANDIAARDLISSYFRFPWRVGPRDFLYFRSRPSPLRPFSCPPGLSSRLPLPAAPPGCSSRLLLPAAPPGGTSGVCCATDGGAAVQVSANHEHAAATV
jgi:hypothetical protein